MTTALRRVGPPSTSRDVNLRAVAASISSIEEMAMYPIRRPAPHLRLAIGAGRGGSVVPPRPAPGCDSFGYDLQQAAGGGAMQRLGTRAGEIVHAGEIV